MVALNRQDFVHEEDLKAMKAMEAVPGFSKLCKQFMRVFSEQQYLVTNKASKLELGPHQLPQVWELLPPICEKLGIAEPDLFLEVDEEPNAYTAGYENPFIVVTTGLLNLMEPEEVQTVLAHECGHIVCGHTIYTTMGKLAFDLSDTYITSDLANLATMGLKDAFRYWERCSDLSADRCAVVFWGGPEKLDQVMLKLTVGSEVEGVSLKSFVQQAQEYAGFVGVNKASKLMEFYIRAQSNHPLTTVRVAEAHKWCKTFQFKNLMYLLAQGKAELSAAHETDISAQAGIELAAHTKEKPGSLDGDVTQPAGQRPTEEAESVIYCPQCGAANEPGWRHCGLCGAPLLHGM